MSITSDLRKLSPVKPGQNVNSVASSDRMNAIQNLLRAVCRGENLMSGDNTRFRRGESFVTISSSAQAENVGSAGVPDISFALDFVKVNDDNSVRTFINYGESNLELVTIDGFSVTFESGGVTVTEFASGANCTLDSHGKPQMPSDKIVTADLFVAGTEIWAEIKYDSTTLVSTISLQFGATLPPNLHTLANTGDEPRGKVIWPIGYVDWDVSDSGKPTNVNPHNRWVGDIDFQLIYGALNGQPAILPVYAGSWALVPTSP